MSHLKFKKFMIKKISLVCLFHLKPFIVLFSDISTQEVDLDSHQFYESRCFSLVRFLFFAGQKTARRAALLAAVTEPAPTPPPPCPLVNSRIKSSSPHLPSFAPSFQMFCASLLALVKTVKVLTWSVSSQVERGGSFEKQCFLRRADVGVT